MSLKNTSTFSVCIQIFLTFSIFSQKVAKFFYWHLNELHELKLFDTIVYSDCKAHIMLLIKNFINHKQVCN